MATGDLDRGTDIVGNNEKPEESEAPKTETEAYRAPQLFVAGNAADLVRGTQVSAQYKDSANDWYSPWPKGPNNPN